MGYDLHITRAKDWSRTAGFEISVSEWIELVHEDPELQTDEENGACAVIWTDASGEARGWFDWYGGMVFTTNPDRATVGKLLALADRLHARVQGDDGELYETIQDWGLDEP